MKNCDMISDNVFANNMSADIKLSKDQISKVIQSGRSFSFKLGNLGKKALEILLFLYLEIIYLD